MEAGRHVKTAGWPLHPDRIRPVRDLWDRFLPPLMERGDVVNYMHEQLMASVFAGLKLPMRSYGLRPMGSGTLALSLLDGFRAIQGGGMAIIAAEGDMLWDGVSGYL